MASWTQGAERAVRSVTTPVVQTVKRTFSMLPTLPWYAWAAGAAAVAVLLGSRAAGATAALPAPDRPSGSPPLLKLGSTGPWVTYLQSLLGIPQTGTFDADTDAAVRAFQAASAPPADGLVGGGTWSALGVSGYGPGPSPGPGPGPSPQPHPQPQPGPAPAPTVGNPFGLSELPPQREPQMLALIDQGKFSHDWEPLDFATKDGHKVHLDVSRFALALHDGANRLIVSMTFNGAQQALDKLGAAMLTSRISDEIWKAATTKIGIPNKSWNTDSPVTGGKLSRMYEQSNDVQAKVAAKGGGQEGLVANEGKDWVITRRFWTNAEGGTNGNLATDKPSSPAGVPGSPHNAANFGWYPGGTGVPGSPGTSMGGQKVLQTIGLAHDRGDAGGFVDYSQYVRGVRLGSLTIDGIPWDWGAALADPTVSSYIQDEGGTIPSPRHPDL